MTYQEVQDRLSKVQSALQSLQSGDFNSTPGINVPTTINQLQEAEKSLKEKLQILAEEEGMIATDDENTAEKFAKKGLNVKLTKEQESLDDRGKYIRLLDMLKAMKKSNVSSSDPKYQELLKRVKQAMDKIGIDSKFIKEMTDQEFADAQEKDRLDKHPEKSTIEKIQALIAAQQKDESIDEASEGKYYIKVAVRDARKALSLIDDSPAYSKAVEMDGSDTYYLADEELAYDLMMDFGAHGIEVTDNNIDLDEAEAPEGGIEKGGDLDVGHQDDEPNMLKKDLYDIITYASKLYKQLDKYDNFDGEVDFPQWWQKKVILARDYMSAAQHYLESEEKQPAIDALALEENRVKVIKEDWGSSDHAHMMQQIHKAIGEPKTMPSPFDNSLEAAVADNVDFYWDDWEEYKQDPQELYTKAKRDYLRYFFKDTFDKMVQMFEPMDEANKREEDKFHKNLDTLVHKTFGKRKEEMKEASHAKIKKEYDELVGKMKQLAQHYKTAEGVKKDKIVAALKQHTTRKKELEKQLDKAVGGIGVGQELDGNLSEKYSVFKNYDEIIGRILVSLSALEDYIQDNKPEAMDNLQKIIAMVNIFDEEMAYGPQDDIEEKKDLSEAKATCCGKCGRVHVKGTECKKPYLTGKKHCRYN